ncbi:hypothetical protein EG329_007603 [Mollisiaceae sp. DMI_Dod_QoI]|nr:hypothetical protein EG329_007603 [Helotiales sp. DMI_Dod_QoI]
MPILGISSLVLTVPASNSPPVLLAKAVDNIEKQPRAYLAIAIYGDPVKFSATRSSHAQTQQVCASPYLGTSAERASRRLAGKSTESFQEMRLYCVNKITGSDVNCLGTRDP